MISFDNQKHANNDIQTEDGQTRRNGEINFMEASGTSTYILKIGRQKDQLHERVKNKHIPPEDRQTKGKGQINFIEGSRTSTYLLKMEKWLD